MNKAIKRLLGFVVVTFASSSWAAKTQPIYFLSMSSQVADFRPVDRQGQELGQIRFARYENGQCRIHFRYSDWQVIPPIHVWVEINGQQLTSLMNETWVYGPSTICNSAAPYQIP